MKSYTVREALYSCGIRDSRNSDYMTDGIFGNSFHTCIDKSMEDLNNDFDTFLSSFREDQRPLGLTPKIKKNIRAFIQWSRDLIRMGKDPSTIAFPVDDVEMLERRRITHEQFVERSKTSILEALKPDCYPNGRYEHWMDWKRAFINYISQIPGRDGVPLSYVIRDHDVPDPSPQPNFLDMYVANAPLHGEAFSIDSALVARLIQSLILHGNSTSFFASQKFVNMTDGRSMFQLFDKHFAPRHFST